MFGFSFVDSVAVSSANVDVLVFLYSVRSAVNNKYNKGPRTLSCGNPASRYWFKV